MRLCSTIIYTDKLAEVSAFYQKFFFEVSQDSSSPNNFTIFPFAEAGLTWIDAASVHAALTQNMLIRIAVPYIVIEHAQSVQRGAPCSDLVVEDWGAYYGERVQCYTVTDPSGTRIVYYEDHYGEQKQLMTTGAGVGTREVQQQQRASE